MQPEMTPIIPLEQAVIHFAGHDFLIVRLLDGRIAVVLRHLCEALDLDRRGQTRRIQSQSALAKHLLLVRIKTPGGPQEVHALVTSVLSLWLGGFRLGRLSEEKRALIELLQSDAADAFQSHFYQVDAQAHPQQQAQASQPPQSPLPPPDVPPVSVFDMLRAAITSMEQEHREIQAWGARLTHVEQAQRVLADQQTEAQRQLQALQAEVLALRDAQKDSPPAPDAALSDEHEQVLYILLYCAQQIIGQPQEELERELLAAAGVQKLGQIREANWFEMVVWLVQRLG